MGDGGDDDGYDDDDDGEEEEEEYDDDDDDDDAGNLVSHVIGGQHGQELTEEDGAKEKSEHPSARIMIFRQNMTKQF